MTALIIAVTVLALVNVAALVVFARAAHNAPTVMVDLSNFDRLDGLTSPKHRAPSANRHRAEVTS